jgi:multidrug resistance efflux pump
MKWVMGMGIVAMLIGCDASKDELASTKSTLASVTTERDNLKSQLATAQQQLDATKAELAKATASATPPANGAKTPGAATAGKTDAAPAAAAKNKHHKS